MLEDDPDKEFILDGVKHGLSIIDKDIVCESIKPVETDNHASTLKPGIRDQVENRIIEEISDGNYVVVDSKPRIISALAAVPKPDKDIRLMHDQLVAKCPRIEIA